MNINIITIINLLLTYISNFQKNDEKWHNNKKISILHQKNYKNKKIRLIIFL